jgi:multidrug efflux system outer membrane protein
LRAAAQSAATALQLARKRYQAGVDDFLPVLDAQRVSLVVENQFAVSETRTATALTSVYKALGGGWEVEEQPAGQQVQVSSANGAEPDTMAGGPGR